MIELGKHGVIVGKTGSGKSQQLIAQALETDAPTVILDTKIDDAFLALARGKQKLIVSESLRAATRDSKRDFDYLIIRPKKEELSSPRALDDYLSMLYDRHGMAIFVDEAYQFHANGRSGTGLHALLTRGRSRKLSLIACTQRPAFVSKFLFSESRYFWIYQVQVKGDRKIISDFTPYNGELPPRFHYFYYDAEEHESADLKPPIPLFKRSGLPKPKIL